MDFSWLISKKVVIIYIFTSKDYDNIITELRKYWEVPKEDKEIWNET